MITPLTHIIAILAVLPLAHFLARPARLALLAAAGAALLLIVAPGSLWVILATGLEGLALERLLRNRPKASHLRQYLPYVLLLNMFYTDVVGRLAPNDWATAGVAFAVIRVFMTTKQLLGAPPTSLGNRIAALALGGFFLPALVIGPVFSGTTLWAQRLAPDEGPTTTELAYRKLFFGWILATLLGPWMLQLCDGTGLDRWQAPLVMIALFFNLFASFWGQSLIAEAGASLGGFSVPQNFNQPWLATDIRDFWNRWHISMAKFVTQYIYLPLNLRGLPARAATVGAFVFMGLWHQVQVGYLIWGLAHGLFMAFSPKFDAGWSASRRIVSRVLTLVVVIGLSYVANYAF
jgi:hypothetical protein